MVNLFKFITKIKNIYRRSNI